MPGFLPKTGNYQELLSYRKAEVIYDFTFRFCEQFLKRGDRTIDQMVQAARSGKQNIAEGSKASVTSTETELKLTNVARQVSKNSSSTTKTSSASATSRSGIKTPARPSMSANSANPPANPSKLTAPFSKSARPQPSPTSPSASSIKPTTSSTNKSAGSKKTSSKLAASANA